jgi:hypothetical protein
MEDLNLLLVEKLWSLEEGRVSSSSEQTHVRKVRFALKTWRAQYKELKSRQDGKNGDVKDMKSDMYQLIGFFSVFQGVLFQGVTQLQIACKFRYIPIALSVAASLGTIIGVSLKFSDLLDIQERSNGDAISIKVLLYYINGIQRQGKDFSFLPPADPPAIAPAVVNSTGCVPGVANYSNPSVAERWKLKKRHDEEVVKKRARLEKELENSKKLKYLILAYLILIGGGFAYVLSVIMCVRY